MILIDTAVIVFQRVDCTNRQCNASQETTSSESCQKCEDLEKCFNRVVSLLLSRSRCTCQRTQLILTSWSSWTPDHCTLFLVFYSRTRNYSFCGSLSSFVYVTRKSPARDGKMFHSGEVENFQSLKE